MFVLFWGAIKNLQLAKKYWWKMSSTKIERQTKDNGFYCGAYVCQIYDGLSLLFVSWFLVYFAISSNVVWVLCLISFIFVILLPTPFPSFYVPDQGTVQKVVVLPNNSSSSGELILEELEVFQVCLTELYPLSFCSLGSEEAGSGWNVFDKHYMWSNVTAFIVGLEFSKWRGALIFFNCI